MNKTATTASDAASGEADTPPRPSRLRALARRLGFWALILIGLVVAQTLAGRLKAPKLPSQAPGFSLASLDGERVSLADLRGRTVVLNFWATWCPPCRTEIPSFSRFADDHPEITVLGVAVDGDAAELRKAKEHLGISYPVLLADRETLAAYRVRGIPQTVVVRPDGTVRSAHVGLLFRPQLWWMTR